ncbi:MAG: sugar transferase [Bacteroidales bacterium]
MKSKILILEDARTIQLILYNVLKEKYEVCMFSDGNSAISWLRKGNTPDFVITDMQMSPMDGFSFLTEFAKVEARKNIPVIVISGLKKVDIKCFSEKINLIQFFSKPFNPLEIVKAIDKEFQLQCKKTSFQKQKKCAHNIRDGNKMLGIPLWKRVFDIAFSLIFLVALSPILLLISIIICAESPGSPIYISKRVGQGFNIFSFYKFRSMYVNAEKNLFLLQNKNRYKDEEKSFVKLDNDPRVTKIGRILRRTSFDELPQLVNIIKGDMSFVGNRPIPIYEAERLVSDKWGKRFLTAAGLTGLWQVKLRKKKGNLSATERKHLDNIYVTKSSFLNDITILFKTIFIFYQKTNS